MSDWEIRLPMRDPGEPLDADAIHDLPKALDGDERQMARELLWQGFMRDFESVGQLADWLEKLDGPGQRRVLDGLRESVGLPDTAQVEFEERHKAAQLNAQARAAATSARMFCAAAGCDAAPRDPATGAPTVPGVQRWWCDQHRDQAGPGDFEPRELRLAVTLSGALREIDEAEEASRAEQERSRRALAEARQAERDLEAKEREAFERARDEKWTRETPPQLRSR